MIQKTDGAADDDDDDDDVEKNPNLRNLPPLDTQTPPSPSLKETSDTDEKTHLSLHRREPQTSRRESETRNPRQATASCHLPFWGGDPRWVQIAGSRRASQSYHSGTLRAEVGPVSSSLA
jgi:hypothetical protein